jgi:RND family efflux transporter MFP subunit
MNSARSTEGFPADVFRVKNRKLDAMVLGKWFGRSVVATAMLGLLPLAGADDAAPSQGEVLRARTVPSHITKPSFMEVGIVRQWMVKADDVVKKGQLLGKQDTDIEDLKLRSARIQADSLAAIEAATADRDARKIEYENKEKAYKEQATSESEVQEAKLDYEQKEAVLRNAQVSREKLLADVDIQSRIIDKMQLFSPIDGTVKDINIQEGEIFDPNKPDGALTLVTNNPLWVQVEVDSTQALKLKQGDIASVAYQNDPNTWLKAKVIYLDPEVDAASDKETIRLELNNDANVRSGLWVSVRLPSDSGGQ